jgi:PD-(D/E)XK nuclease superfamily protein
VTITEKNRASGFRPSKFPALEACIRFEGTPVDSEAARRGTDIHAEIAKWFRAPQDFVISTEAQWALSEINRLNVNPILTEQVVMILDELGEEITSGTIDLVGESGEDLWIFDWKTGDKRDYSAQLAAYALAVMDDNKGFQKVVVAVCYVDLRETEIYDLDYATANARVLELYERWKARKTLSPTLCHYCDWCALKGSCEAWIRQAETALAISETLNANLRAIDNLKNSPGQLSEFLIAYDRLKKLVDDEWRLKEAMKTHLQTGHKDEHYIVVDVSEKEVTTEYIDPEMFLVDVVKEIGTMRAAQAISIDPVEAQKMWSGFTSEPFPIPVLSKTETKAGYSYVKAKPRKGSGMAALARRNRDEEKGSQTSQP